MNAKMVKFRMKNDLAVRRRHGAFVNVPNIYTMFHGETTLPGVANYYLQEVLLAYRLQSLTNYYQMMGGGLSPWK